MPLIVYGADVSPPCRAVYIVAQAIGISLERKDISLANQDHLKPEYLKINPLHTIPTLDDNGVIIPDSHAIITYLVGKYGKDDALYPKDLVKRAAVDSKLYFDATCAFNILKICFRAYLYHGQKGPLTELQRQQILDVYDYLNTVLEKQKWVTGDAVTLADISLLPTVTSLDLILPIDDNKNPHVGRWVKDAESLPYFSINQRGLDEFKDSWKWVTSL
uniref:Glutathione S-transferase e4 n=1 Tax=Sitophilus zeamais TaxID=7047 RepID=A0A8F0D7D5_SITZE|nr:glutathione S-transferase e4 [Sitophilus zeamais]